MFHQAVLLEEAINGLITDPNGIYVDATFGGGGHSAAILKHIDNGRLIAFDQDEDTAANRIQDERFLLIHANFRYLKNFLRYHNAIPVSGILADLGISSFQIDTPEKGFSLRFDEKLDMRMDRNQEKDAWFVVNHYSEEELTRIFSDFGEIRHARSLSKAIVEARDETPIDTTGRLAEIAGVRAPKNLVNKFNGQVFQAIRMEVNDESGSLLAFLNQCMEVIRTGGRLVVISYHSLEDRMVKNFMKAGNEKGEAEKDFFGHSSSPFRQISRKPVTPGIDELKRNPRSRSAKMRIAEKI
ncbi:MAG: 16S rRNA (cytosine(1402)-N(4))-methyltransferase RsmH [Bacteroidetes bacterium]|nr:16S rRNA (cytosine(1402)-N(4))-methyltransferase RsmH [Bacteroidota bacterium]